MDKNCGNGRWKRNGVRLTAYQRLEELVDLRTQAAVFRLFLQPLVENAIVHGLAVKPEGGRLHIRSWIKEHRIFISVSDTGAGIAPERLEEIRAELKRGESQKLGIGVSNISRRLKTMYPDGELVIDSREGRGTVVRMAFTASEIF